MADRTPDQFYRSMWSVHRTPGDFREAWRAGLQCLGRDASGSPPVFAREDTCHRRLLENGIPTGPFMAYIADELGEGLTPENIKLIEQHELAVQGIDWLRSPDRIPGRVFAGYLRHAPAREDIIKRRCAMDMKRFTQVLATGLDYDVWLSRSGMNPVCRMHFIKMVEDMEPAFRERLKDTADSCCPKAFSMLSLEKGWADGTSMATARWVYNYYREMQA